MKVRKISLFISAILVMGGAATAALAEEVIQFEDVVVTGVREKESRAETSATVGSVSTQEVKETKPAHPSEIMDRIPGVQVSVTNGEGHTTAIRQPNTTSAVYLYLEDGIPTRSTGFFNHNALYEVNVPQAEGIEVLKGPGTSLYGSDAIGGVINVMTRPAPATPEFEATREWGEFGWERTLLSGGNTSGQDGFRADINSTRTDGWRDSTEYDRTSTTLRWERYLDSGATLKTVLSESDIDQQTAGNSRLKSDDFYNNPTANYTPISYRQVEATRLSVAYEKETGDSLFSATPFYRHNVMELMPNWALGYDPTIYETKNDSFGLLLKYRKDLDEKRTRIVAGVDIDYSPGSRDEWKISRTKVGNIYTAFENESTIYNYDVDYQGISPYIHLETSPTDKLRLNAGVRYDAMSYDYDDKLSTPATAKHQRPADTKVDFDHFSPKLGATYAFSDSLNGFLSYRHAFRVPSEGQMFRQGSSTNTVGLQPVKVDSYETGVRGKAGDRVRYELSLYHMTKKDDILSYRDPVTFATQAMNAGETQHRGVEIGMGVKITEELAIDAAYSYAEHTYEEWIAKVGGSNVDFSGKEMAAAPNVTSNVRINYRPGILNGGKTELEWIHVGKYWMDQANTYEYQGHDVLNFRANMKIGKSLDIFARLMNVADKRYATAATYKAPSTFEYAPGMPRTAYAGLTYKWDGE